MEQWNQTRLLTSDHNLNQNMFLININNSSVKASDIYTNSTTYTTLHNKT